MTAKDSHLNQFTNMTLSLYFKCLRYSSSGLCHDNVKSDLEVLIQWSWTQVFRIMFYFKYKSVILSILVLTNNRGRAAAECVLVKTKTINHQGSHWLMITSQAVITTFILYNLSVTSVNHQTPSISVSVFILKCVLFLFLRISGTNRYISKVGSKILIKKGYFLTTEIPNWEDAEVSHNF